MALSLSGSWSLKPKGSDAVSGLEDVAGIPIVSQMISPLHQLTIARMHRPCEEIHIAHIVSGKTSQAYYQLGRVAFESVTSDVVLGTVVNISEDFSDLSILRMGPAKGQRSLEHFRLDENGNEIRVEVDHVLPEGQLLKLVKILQRLPVPSVSDTIAFQTSSLVNNWSSPQSHAPSTIRNVQVKFINCIEVVTNGATARRATLAGESSGSPKQTSPNHSMLARQSSFGSGSSYMRRFNGEFTTGDTVQLFVVEISVAAHSWICRYQYRELDAFQQFVSTQLQGVESQASLPPFPCKSMSKIRGKSLEQRKLGLEAYLTALCATGGYNILNVVDALASLLEIPEHTVDSTTIPKAQAVLRQQMLGNFPSFDAQPEINPKHMLSSMLREGLRVIKYGRHGRPKERMLFRGRDEDLLMLYWADQADLGAERPRNADGIPLGARSLSLRSVREIRRGTASDPSCPEYCGTSILRKNCEPADYAYCISLICADRTLDFKMLSRDEYDAFVPNLLRHHRDILQNDTGDFNDLYVEVAFRKSR